MGRASPFQRGAIPAEGEEGVTLKPHSLKVLLPAVGPGFSVLEIEIGFECSGGDRVPPDFIFAVAAYRSPHCSQRYPYLCCCFRRAAPRRGLLCLRERLIFQIFRA
jgi:hypothetical protein